jgi:hypothetical protein
MSDFEYTDNTDFSWFDNTDWTWDSAIFIAIFYYYFLLAGDD